MLITRELSTKNAKIIHEWLTLVIPFDKIEVKQLLWLARDIVYSKKWEYIVSRQILKDMIDWFPTDIS